MATRSVVSVSVSLFFVIAIARSAASHTAVLPARPPPPCPGIVCAFLHYMAAENLGFIDAYCIRDGCVCLLLLCKHLFLLLLLVLLLLLPHNMLLVGCLLCSWSCLVHLVQLVLRAAPQILGNGHQVNCSFHRVLAFVCLPAFAPLFLAFEVGTSAYLHAVVFPSAAVCHLSCKFNRILLPLMQPCRFCIPAPAANTYIACHKF